jgi:hypothetical protein
MSRAAISQLSFADWELMRQGLELEPLLQAISDFLDDHEGLIGKIRGDLRRGLTNPDTGRSGLVPREVLRSLERHKKAFGRAPELYGADRGFYSERNLTLCQRSGVNVVCIPQSGGKRVADRDAYEKTPAFKQGQRFRAGIEGRISVLFRGRGMKRCLAEGKEHFELLVGAAVLANNLMNIAAWLTTRTTRSQRRAA